MQRKWHHLHLILLILLCCSTSTLAWRRKKRVPKTDEAKIIQQELERYRSRNSNLNRELKELQTAMSRDSARIVNLNKEHKEIITLLEGDLKKLKKEEEELQKSEINLKKKIRGLEWWIKREEQGDNLLRTELLRQCDTLESFLKRLTNAVTDSRLRAVQLLQSEIKSKTIETAEAADRLFSLYDAIDREVHTTDVWQSGPPVAGTTGRFYYIRVGLIYTAAVSDNGTSAYLYLRNSWIEITSQEERTALLSAAESAVGSRPPELSLLPMRLQFVSDTLKGDE